MLRCLIVDDSSRFPAAARDLLELAVVTVVGVASTGSGTIQSIRDLRPDATLLDIDLGIESGLEVARRIQREAGPGPVVLISTHSEQDFADLIAESPVSGSCPRSASRLTPCATCSRPRGASGDRSLRSASLQEPDDREDAAVVGVGLGKAQLGQDAAHVFLNGSLSDP
jgi:DNA-binding NarL/FixJ family response regulator